jgi:hypothetical protein
VKKIKRLRILNVSSSIFVATVSFEALALITTRLPAAPAPQQSIMMLNPKPHAWLMDEKIHFLNKKSCGCLQQNIFKKSKMPRKIS